MGNCNCSCECNTNLFGGATTHQKQGLLPYPVAVGLRRVALSTGRLRVRELSATRAIAEAEEAAGFDRDDPEEAVAAAKEAVLAAAHELGECWLEACNWWMELAAHEAARAAEDGCLWQAKKPSEPEPDKPRFESQGMDVEKSRAVERLVKSMAAACGSFWGFTAARRTGAAQQALTLALRCFRDLHWGLPPWRGANLGGWFLLEPGPASPFFEVCRSKIAECNREVLETHPMEDEHSLCCALVAAGGSELRQQMFAQHRARHFSEATFDKISSCRLNAVRLPFGYWVVAGPAKGEAYDGPCMQYLDHAVHLAGSRGLQVLLDLHGNPGGESGDRPSGRESASWQWLQWRRHEAVEVLRFVARRYHKVDCVTGLQVCNEPSMTIPIGILCDFYEEAVLAIRAEGMSPDRVAVVLPAFTHWRLAELVECWRRRGNFLKYDNVAFDLHYYHCFSPAWALLSHEEHLDVIREHAVELASLPGAVVGEWSLERPDRELLSREPLHFTQEQVAEFATQQVLGYNHASHGWFFWNWHDHRCYVNWDMEGGVFGKGRLPTPLGDDELFNLLLLTGPDAQLARRKPVQKLVAAVSWFLKVKAKLLLQRDSINESCFSGYWQIQQAMMFKFAATAKGKTGGVLKTEWF